MSDFNAIKVAISDQFNAMVEDGDLFRVNVDGDALWEAYLASFPSGTNPMFRKRTEHDCSCCKSFIRRVGDVVTIRDGRVVSIWDCNTVEPYRTVAKALSKLVTGAAITEPFLSSDQQIGTDKNYEQGDTPTTWHHFHVTLPPARRNAGKNYVVDKAQIATMIGDAKTTRDLFYRGLTELTRDALDTVVELIDANSLYRGAEHAHSVKAFLKLKKQFDLLPAAEQSLFAWAQYDKCHPSVARIRNTAIGTLLIDLSAGIELEDAVNKFEKSIMAPTNYKRPTALVSKAMVEKAKQQLQELDLLPALERRFARRDDITINNVLWASREARIKGNVGPFDGIATKAAMPKDLSRVETMSIETFLASVVPHASSIELLLENKHTKNLVSLIAPQHPSAQPLFKWSNGFSWAYNGDATDSIKERVKRAGGNVSGDLCCRLAWFNFDDLDFHMREPRGSTVYYGNKRSFATGGELDVDMNAGAGTTREPVENIFYRQAKSMPNGKYELSVHQFNRREQDNAGFEVEVEFMGEVQRFAYTSPMRTGQRVVVMQFEMLDGEMKVTHALSSMAVSRTAWGLKTSEFHPVDILMRSPNYWDDQIGIGNKHYFFMLRDCVNDGEPRGFFNEFLRPELSPHRKVLEIVGGKAKVASTAAQLSGVGFSETQHAEILVRVKGKTSRTLKVLI